MKGLIGLSIALILASGASHVVAADHARQIAEVEIQYQQNKRKNADTPEVYFGKYWGSGNGRIKGEINGTVHWDLYEDQSRDDLHRGQLVGVVITDTKQRIPFEGLGFYKPRKGGYWDLTASFNFDCKGGCPWKNSQPLIWKGTVKWGEWVHRARLYLVE